MQRKAKQKSDRQNFITCSRKKVSVSRYIIEYCETITKTVHPSDLGSRFIVCRFWLRSVSGRLCKRLFLDRIDQIYCDVKTDGSYDMFQEVNS